MWLSKRLLESVPRADSTWAEGEDKRLAWADLRAFFASLDVDEQVGGDDGFVRLTETKRQRNRLMEMAKEK